MSHIPLIAIGAVSALAILFAVLFLVYLHKYDQCKAEDYTEKVAVPVASMTAPPTVKRPTILAPAMTESNVAATAGVIPRSIPCTTICKGIVVNVAKCENCIAQSIQKVGSRLACWRLTPLSALSFASPSTKDGRFIKPAPRSKITTAPVPRINSAERQSVPAMRKPAATGMEIWPKAVPTFTTAVISPRRR